MSHSKPKEQPSITASLVHRGWLRRIFALSGAVEVKLEYSARRAGIGLTRTDTDRVDYGHDLLVDGAHLSYTHVGGDPGKLTAVLLTPRGNLPIHIEVELHPGWTGMGLVRIARFQLKLADTLVYEESGGKATLQRSPLPIPATPHSSDTLPIPAETTLAPENLPLPAEEGNH